MVKNNKLFKWNNKFWKKYIFRSFKTCTKTKLAYPALLKINQTQPWQPQTLVKLVAQHNTPPLNFFFMQPKKTSVMLVVNAIVKSHKVMYWLVWFEYAFAFRQLSPFLWPWLTFLPCFACKKRRTGVTQWGQKILNSKLFSYSYTMTLQNSFKFLILSEIEFFIFWKFSSTVDN